MTRNNRRRLSGDDGAEASGAADFENGYLKDAKRQLMRLSAMSPAHFDESLGIISQLTLTCWMGGPVVQATITSSALFPQLYKWVNDTTTPFAPASDQEAFRFHESVVELMIVLCHRCKANQDGMRKTGWIELLIELSSRPRSRLKKLAITCLLFLLMNNTANQFWTLKIANIQDRITGAVAEDWTDHPSNYADDLLNLLDLAQNTIRSGNGRESLVALFESIIRH